MREGRMSAEAMASADFDEDGMPDLAVVHSGAEGAGAIALYRGNVDAVFPNEPGAKQRRANGTFVDAPFLSDVKVFDTPEGSDLVGAGDFDGDGHRDVVVARRGGKTLFWHRGDGKGELGKATKVTLPGRVAAMEIGAVNRWDGLEDIVVAVEVASGGRVLIFEGSKGAFSSVPEEIPLAARPTAIALGRLDEDAFADLTIASGRILEVIRGLDRKAESERVAPPSVLRATLPLAIQSVAVGNFAGKGTEIALLDASHRLAFLAARDLFADPGDAVGRLTPLAVEGAADPSARLVRARVSVEPGDDLILLDRERSSVLARHPAGEGRGRSLAVAQDLGAVQDTLGLRLGPTALDGLAMIVPGEAQPLMMDPEPLVTYVVTNTSDSGAGSLRQAILDANASAGLDEIDFSIPGGGTHTITLATPLPDVMQPTIVDGTTEPDYAGTTPVVRLDGNGLTSHILRIRGGVSTVRGLSMGRQGGAVAGISLSDADGNVVEGNFIGTNAAGTASGPTAGYGILVASQANRIGGTVEEARNIVSGNGTAGILVQAGGDSTRVLGNYVGLDVMGAAPVPNGEGIAIVDASYCTVGVYTGGGRNVIGGNVGKGIRITSASGESRYNLVVGNYIGVAANGITARGNETGVLVDAHPDNFVGGSFTSGSNVISGNDWGIVLGGTGGTQVTGNYIGLSASGLSSVPNGTGVAAFGPNNRIGSAAAQGNVISGNTDIGVLLAGDSTTGNVLEANRIGTDPSGSVALPNARGVYVHSLASGNTIGGSVAGAGNLISGNNRGIDLHLEAGSVIVRGNLIGTNLAGTAALPNVLGIYAGGAGGDIGDVVPEGRNVISGNTSHGIEIRSFGYLVYGNDIGTTADGMGALGNGANGLRIQVPTSALPDWIGIGDPGAGLANTIAYNGAAGIAVVSGAPVQMRGNAIHSNGGLGIDLGGDSVTLNDTAGDGDTGPNGLQNFPVINVARALGGTLTVSGTLSSTPGVLFTIDVYTSPVCDPSGYGEGATHIGSATTTTDGSGAGSWSLTLTGSFGAGDIVTTTAHRAVQTSEFSACRTVEGTAPDAVTGLKFETSPTEAFSWDAAPGASQYNVYVGTRTTIAGLATQSSDSCLVGSLPETQIEVPPDADPPPGEMLWILVSASNQYGEGPMQPWSGGPRVLTSTGQCTASCAHDPCGVGAALQPACSLVGGFVCGKDPSCCDPVNGTWDFACVQQVRTVARSLTCPESQGQCAHTLCENGSPLQAGCDKPPLATSCTALVCAADPHCCQQAWDDACRVRMTSLCGYNCL